MSSSLHSTYFERCKTDLKSRNDLFWYQWSLIQKTNPKLEATFAAWISYEKDTLCTNVYRLCGDPAIHTKASTHSYQVSNINMTKLWLNTTCQNYQISPQTEDNGVSDSQRSQKEQFYPACTNFPLRLIFLKLSPLPCSRTMS